MSAADRPPLSVRLLAWFGWSGAPAAWTVQHVFGFGFTQAACGIQGSPRDVPIDGLALGAGITVFVIGAAALAAAAAAFRATSGAEQLPGERVHFMAVVGLAITPLFLCIMVFNAVGVLVLDRCTQS